MSIDGRRRTSFRMDRTTATLLLAACLCAAVRGHRTPPGTSDRPEVVVPERIDGAGRFVGHGLARHFGRGKRSAEEAVHYRLPAGGRDLLLTLRPNRGLLAPAFVVERRRGSNSTFHRSRKPSEDGLCYYRGNVRNDTGSSVALSTCDGLMGVIRTEGEELLIQPMPGGSEKSGRRPHLLYKRSTTEVHGREAKCGNRDDVARALKYRAEWEKKKKRKKKGRSRSKRSVSVERNVETLVVADKAMVDYYSDEDIETYILTVMNVVSSLYHDASIGNAINVILVRLILLESEEQEKEDLYISHHADDTLKSFCKWQKYVNPRDENHPHHHDVAVLLTRYNICTRVNEPCSTLGLAEVAGMCQPHRSCNVNEDTGLALAYTIAHELGHNFGMSHDGPHNGCQAPLGERQHVMSPHLNSDASPFVWSNCSRSEITKFLDRDWGSCLDDEPSDHEFTFPELPPGAMYNSDHQCRLQYGPEAEYCEGIEDVCQTLWCRQDNKCVTRLEPAAEGTLCDKNKWCYMGKCTVIGERLETINGEWGSWSPWSECSRSCGAGVMHSERHCDNPMPGNGGQYCIGERKRYRICQTEPCPENSPSFRSVQCSEFDNIPYKEQLYTWLPVSTPLTPCQLHCKPKGKFFSVMLSDTAKDGTPCNPGTNDMCINGKCRNVACDWGIDSNAQEDRCGICHGDGTQCQTIHGNFLQKKGLGYVEVLKIPTGARNFRIEELGDANNYIAIQDSSREFQLNGQWFIQWSGEYPVAGTIFYYSREGEKESLHAPGPTKEPVYILLLFQTENPGLSYEYTIPNKNITRKPEFHWQYTDWSVCSATCNGGIQISRARCLEKEAGLVEDIYCSDLEKPVDISRICNRHQCPARWWAGPWQHCSVSCGSNGIRKRTVICVRSLGPDEQIALLDEDCDAEDRPSDSEPCRHKHPCLMHAHWETGQWTDVCDGDPCNYQSRHVYCNIPNGFCNEKEKPISRRKCGNITCGVWVIGNWSECSKTCGTGYRRRNITCQGGEACQQAIKPVKETTCNEQPCLPFDDIQIFGVVHKSNDHKNNKGGSDHKHRHHHGEDKHEENENEERRSDKVAKDVIVVPLYEVPDNRVEDVKVDNEIDEGIHQIRREPPTVPEGGRSNPKQDSQKYEWQVTMWEKCSKPCDGGVRNRRALCFDAVTKHMVVSELCDPFEMPSTEESCNLEPCLDWILTEWSECSSSCDRGLQYRKVYCPEEDKCDPEAKPSETRVCLIKSCLQWIAGPWSQCSASCGEGFRRRHVKCVDLSTQASSSRCSADDKPSHLQQCVNQECAEHNSAFSQCRDKLEVALCQSLRHMCDTWYFKAKCCHTCNKRINSRRRTYGSRKVGSS
ncbi:A disintegrin and metalloproteinase with thrombospondin motifs 7-like [Centruroides sculpturatus]|uniref:A disintegrin and metalloproteinase with thrombospondin motifs 7-like n=1 Tax=Centruroides sculpturatus TaxID=218467 RepID=UPI000C6DBC2A|nr:A disintegrin and metalloproteinase with thrombospondin motifs 7-like [Centruroides sculpturatus]